MLNSSSRIHIDLTWKWDRGRAIHFLGIIVSNFRYCVFAEKEEIESCYGYTCKLWLTYTKHHPFQANTANQQTTQ
jgi:hypothetical protein